MRLFAIFLAVIFLSKTLFVNQAFAMQASPAAGFDERLDSEITKRLKMASNEHDLILLFIESGKYDKIEAEWKKVLDLKLGNRYEGAIALSLLKIADKLSEAKQIQLAQRILDYTLANMSFSNKTKADIFRYKAYLFKEAGDLEKAIDAYKYSNELLEKP